MLCECSKCKGTGIVNSFLHVQDGKCFSCKGTGKINIKQPLNKYMISVFCVKLNKRIKWIGVNAKSENQAIKKIKKLNPDSELGYDMNTLEAELV